jgi:predicted dehydrogenase
MSAGRNGNARSVPARARSSAPLGVLVVGCGYWGRNYVRVLHELGSTRVIGVCDREAATLKTIGAAFPDVRLVTSLDEGLKLPGVEAVVVATPASTHCAVASRCLRAGLPVLVEKPLAVSTAEADILIGLATWHDVTLMTGHTFVYNAAIRKMKQYIDVREAGRIYYLYARRTSLGPIRTDVNALWDLAFHDVSIFNYLLDAEPEWLSATGASVLGAELQDVGFVSLGYPGGIVGHIHVSWADPNKRREVVVVGSRKQICFDDLNALERVRVFNKGVTAVTPSAPNYGEFMFQLRDGDIVSPMVEVSEPLKNQCAHFVDCVRTGRRPLTDATAGRSIVRIMEAVDQSVARRGEPVAIAPTEDDVERQVQYTVR